MDSFDINGKENILNFLSKDPHQRKEEEIRRVSRYFSEHYQYFIKLKSNKDFGFQRIEKITKFAKLEIYLQNENIINYGESGDKFYILLEGSVALYKPVYYEEYLTPIEFSDLLIKIRDIESDISKYERLIEKNNHLPFKVRDIEKMEGMKPNYMFFKVKIFLEKLEKIGVFGEGFSFGEMALIRKTTRNATIRAIQKSYLLTLEKKDYNNAIKELQEKKLSKDIEKFISSYPIFKMLYKEKILELLHNLKKKIIYKGEYLFKQNDESDYIYFLNNGTVNLNFNISFSWLNEYLLYFNKYSGNLLFYLIDRKPKKFSELVDIFEEAKKEMDKNHYLKNENKEEKKADENKKYEKWEEFNEKINEGNLIGLKAEEEKLNSSVKIFNVNLKNISPFEIIGLDDAIECRKRTYSSQCISEHAEFDCIKIFDLIKIICTLEDKYIYNLLNFILKRKNILKSQLINKLKYLEKNILISFNNKYDILKGGEINIKKEEDKNRIISVIKMKGFKTNIQELLDKDLILPSFSLISTNLNGKKKKIRYNSTEKDLIENNKKDMKILKYIYKLSISNPHIVKCKNKKELFHNKNYTQSKTFRNDMNNHLSYQFSERNKPILDKNFSLSSHMKNNLNHLEKNNYLFKSYLFNSNYKKSKDKLTFTKIIPKLNLNNNLSKENKVSLTNKILSLYTSPLKDFSSTYTDITEHKKIYPILNSHNNNVRHQLTKLTKLSKMKILDLTREKNNNDEINIIENKIENKNKIKDDEKTYYEKLEKNTKEFILEKKFNKKFRNELNKIKPWKYRTFYNK